MALTNRYGRTVVLAVVATVCAACGKESGSVTGQAGTGGFPVTVDAGNGAVVIPDKPDQIISLSPTATEMLYAIGAGDQVVAVDDQSNYPNEAPKTKLSGFQPNAEAVAQRNPDLVVVANDINEIVSSLDALQVPTLLQPAATKLDDSYEQIEELGEATGHSSEARRLVASMRSQISRFAESAPKRSLAYYHELDQKLFSVTSSTFIGQVYGLLGLRNVADAAEGAGTGYPQLSAEYLIRADPDVVFLADAKCCGQTAEKVAQRPGWNKITAVRTGAVIELDDDIASRWGPRIVDLLRVVADRIAELDGTGR